MYIEGKYWDNYIGGSDDSLTLVEYLAEKQKDVIQLKEIFSDFGLDKLNGSYRQPKIPLVFVDSKGFEVEIHYAINIITDLAALLLECKMSGTINLGYLVKYGLETSVPEIYIQASPEENELMNEALKDFVSAPFEYDLSEMCSEVEMQEIADICEKLRKELYN